MSNIPGLGVQIFNDDFVEEPAGELTAPGVVVPDTEERERANTLLSVHQEVTHRPTWEMLQRI